VFFVTQCICGTAFSFEMMSFGLHERKANCRSYPVVFMDSCRSVLSFVVGRCRFLPVCVESRCFIWRHSSVVVQRIVL